MLITRLLLIAVLCLSVVPATADDAVQANRLLVEAVKLLEEAATKSEIDKAGPLQDALAKLNEIVDDHPSSETAVKLVTGQPIGFLLLSDLQHQIVTAQLMSGDVEGALATAKQMSAIDQKLLAGGVPRDKALWQVVEAQSKAGDVEGAMTTADLTSGGINDGALEVIVAGQLAAGDFEGAATTAKRIKDDFRRDMTLQKIRMQSQ